MRTNVQLYSTVQVSDTTMLNCIPNACSQKRWQEMLEFTARWFKPTAMKYVHQLALFSISPKDKDLTGLKTNQVLHFDDAANKFSSGTY